MTTRLSSVLLLASHSRVHFSFPGPLIFFLIVLSFFKPSANSASYPLPPFSSSNKASSISSLMQTDFVPAMNPSATSRVTAGDPMDLDPPQPVRPFQRRAITFEDLLNPAAYRPPLPPPHFQSQRPGNPPPYGPFHQFRDAPRYPPGPQANVLNRYPRSSENEPYRMYSQGFTPTAPWGSSYVQPPHTSSGSNPPPLTSFGPAPNLHPMYRTPSSTTHTPFATSPIMNPFGNDHHMTHGGWTGSDVDHLMAPNIYQQPLPPPVVHTHPSLPSLGKANIKIKSLCQICLEKFDGDDIAYDCSACTTGRYCGECLKRWFLDACKNESRMPARCCTVIPVSAAANLLTATEIELYKAKFEEWATPNRLYCPVLTCSTFIHPRLYVQRTGAESHSQWNQTKPDGSFSVNTTATAIANGWKSFSPAQATKPNVNCPTCGISVCTKCRALTHVGPCPETDLDPDLENLFKKWKIKRCPKCRTGVRKVYGCSHVQCLCGAHFCWECMFPIVLCDGSCEDRDEYDEGGSQPADDDLDGNAGFYDGDGHEFGPEPHDNDINAWGCDHRWKPLQPETNSPTGVLECGVCFAALQIPEAPKDYPEKQTSPDAHGNLQVFGGTIEEAPPQIWTCYEEHTICARCPKQARSDSFRHDDSTRLWRCDCGIVCPLCDKSKAEEVWRQQRALLDREKESWQCRCGMMVCGVCRDEAFRERRPY